MALYRALDEPLADAADGHIHIFNICACGQMHIEVEDGNDVEGFSREDAATARQVLVARGTAKDRRNEQKLVEERNNAGALLVSIIYL